MFICLHLGIILLVEGVSSLAPLHKSSAVDKASDRSSRNRIINGAISPIEDHPWISFIHLEFTDPKPLATEPVQPFTTRCAGSFLAPNLVVTAKHCLILEPDEDGIESPYDRPFGYVTFATSDHSEVNHQIPFYKEDITPCPDGIKGNGDKTADVAVILLTQSVPSGTENFRTIQLNKVAAVKEGDFVTVSGWGLMCSDDECTWQDKKAERLQSANIKVTDKTSCSTIKEPTRPWEFCAGGEQEDGEARDACEGDSGGPVECKDSNGDVYLCGTVAKGPPGKTEDTIDYDWRIDYCGEAPGVYVNVNAKFIHKFLKQKTAEAIANPSPEFDTAEHVTSQTMMAMCVLHATIAWLLHE